MLLGQARGKVGDLVFSRANGQQITRARAAVVANPQTEKQMIQRIILNTIAQAYSRMSVICDHSFEGVPVGQRSMSRFLKLNMDALRQKVANWVNAEGTFEGVYAFAPKGTNAFTPNAYVISTGQLPEVNIASISAVDGAAVQITKAATIPTYAEVIGSLGLNRGDQLTFIGQELYTDGRAHFHYARVILDPRNADGSQADLTVPFLNGNAINLPSPRNEGEDVKFGAAANGISFDFGDRSQFGAAVIVSRQKADGSWLRSNATISLAEGIPYAMVGAYDLAEALIFTMSGGIDLESERYLNNAVRGKKIVAPSPSPSPDPSPTPGEDPELSSLTVGERDAMSEETEIIDVTFYAPQYQGNNLNGSYLVLAANSLQPGQACDVSSLATDRKQLLTSDSGRAGDLDLTGGNSARLFLVKNNVVISRHAIIRVSDD